MKLIILDRDGTINEDPALKANRLGLLATLHTAMNRVADLSKLAS
jgi:glycyl-tRNA synthetase beta chain